MIFWVLKFENPNEDDHFLYLHNFQQTIRKRFATLLINWQIILFDENQQLKMFWIKRNYSPNNRIISNVITIVGGVSQDGYAHFGQLHHKHCDECVVLLEL